MEIDDHVAQTSPLPVWLFADGELVQRLLIEEGLASVSISNPEYTYAAQLQAAQSQPVICPRLCQFSHGVQPPAGRGGTGGAVLYDVRLSCPVDSWRPSCPPPSSAEKLKKFLNLRFGLQNFSLLRSIRI